MLHLHAAAALRSLAGDAFQTAVWEILFRNVESFQPVKATPADGGVDGLSHDEQYAYCCYGLTEDNVRASKRAKLKTDVCTKFHSDLRRICELEPAKQGFKHAPNRELAGIHSGKRQLGQVHLLCNWNADSSVIGNINAYFDSLKKASQQKFVSGSTSMVFLGPEDIVSKYPVSPELLFTLQQPKLMQILGGSPPTTQPPVRTLLDDKFDALQAALPASKASHVDGLRADFYQKWLAYLARLRQLTTDLPDRARAFGEVERMAEVFASRQSVVAKPGEAIECTERTEAYVAAALVRLGIPQTTAESFASELAARLVGHCALDWR